MNTKGSGRRRVIAVGAGLLLSAVLTAPALRAQAVYGSITGTVTDPSGAAVPNAKVTITSTAQGVSFTTTTNATGYFENTRLIVGTYNVTAEAPGFQTFVQKGVAVSVDAATAVNIKLQVGRVTQTVTVTGGVPLLQTQKTEASLSFSTHYITHLPLYNRNFSYFELYTPGAQQLQWQHAASEDPQGTIQIEVNGQEFGGTDYQLDGTDNHDVILGIMVVNPNLDSLSEAKMVTNDTDAEFSQADAGVLIAQTKSGSNQIHGSVFGYRRTDKFEARDPFAQSVPNTVTGKFIPHTMWNQFGGSLGGPIKKDKIFIFGDYQGSRIRNGGSLLTRVPTALERTGDLSDLATPIFNPFDASGNILPPGQRTQFNCTDATGGHNCIPPSMLSSQAQKLLAFIPLPNVPGATLPGENNYAATGEQPFNINNFDVRADDYYTQNLHLFGRYSFQQYYQQSPGAYGEEAGGPNFENIRFSGISSARTQSLASGFDYVVSPTTVTDFRFGFFRYRVAVSPNGLGTTPAADAGIPGLNLNSVTSGMPAFFIGGTGGFNFGYGLGVNGCNCPLNEQEMQFQLVNNWTKMVGNHTFKFGADIRHAYNLRVPSDTHRAGELSFNTNLTQGPGGSGGLGLADFLLGSVDHFGRYVSNSTDAAERQNRMFFYGEDTWRLTPKLTVHYGTRWDIFFPQTVTGPGKGGWVNPVTFEDMVAGSPGIGLNGGIRNSFTNFGPVAGIAYQVNKKTVVRLGYSRDFDVGLFGSVFGHTVTQNIPVLAQQEISPSQPFLDVFTLAQGPPALDPNTILDSQPRGPSGRPLYPAQFASPHVLPLKMRVPTVDTWNLTVQRELSSNMSFQLAWVGAKGTHVFAGDGPNYNTNGPTIVGYSTASLPNCAAPCTFAREPYFLDTYNYLLSSGFSQAAAFADAWSQGVQWYGNDTSDNYNSLQASFKRRFAQGLGVIANYTWSRCFDEGGPYVNISQRIAYEPCDFNKTQTVSVENVWQLPFGRGRRFGRNVSRWEDYAIGGWEYDADWVLTSGYPFSPGFTNCGSVNDVGDCLPIQRGSAVLGNRTQNQWFKISPVTSLAPGQCAGVWCAPAVGTLGTAAPDSLIAPHYFDADMSLMKSFRVTERVTGKFQFEMFNAFNVANLGYPNSTVDSPTAGLIQGLAPAANNTVPMRNVQFALRFDW